MIVRNTKGKGNTRSHRYGGKTFALVDGLAAATAIRLATRSQGLPKVRLKLNIGTYILPLSLASDD